MQNCLESIRQHCPGFWPVQCCPRSIKAKWHRIFFYAMLSGAFWTILYRVLLSNYSRGSRKQCVRKNPVQIVLILLRKHCTAGNPMQCCTRGSRQLCTRTNRILLHKVLTCVKFSQKYWDKFRRLFLMQCCLEPLGQHGIGFLPVQCCPNNIKVILHRIFLCNVIWSLSDNIA